MAESPEVVELVERLVREANLSSARAREELRRELLSHFEASGSSPEALRGAVERFGDTQAITEAFRRAYRRGRRALYAVKVVAAIVVCSLVALVIQVVIGIPFGLGSAIGRISLDPTTTTLYSIAIILVAVAAWELGIDPLCARLERRPLRLIATFAILLAVAHVTHSVITAMADPAHDVAAGTLTLATWMSTIAILSRLDLAFLRLFGVSK